MDSTDSVLAEASGSATAETPPAATVLFPDDRGQLAEQTRRVLVQLLRGPAVDGRRHPKLWPVLLQEEATLRSRLHELFLELIVDRDMEVAFTRQVSSADIDVPILLRRVQLTFFDTVLLLFLRQRLTSSDAQGERAVASSQEMRDHLQVFEKQGNVDHSRFDRQMDKTIDRANTLGLLHKIRGSEGRYEVSPTLKLLLPAEEVQELARLFEELALKGARQADTTDIPDDSAEPSEAEPEADDTGVEDAQ